MKNKRNWNLIFVDFTVLQLRLALFLKGDDDQSDEYVYEEEWKHDKVYDVEYGHFYSKIVYRTPVLVGRVHRVLKNLWPTLARLYSE